MKTVLVTGGAGYIGSAIVKELLDNEYEVAVVDNLSTGQRDKVDSRATFYERDCQDSLSDVFSNHSFSAVIHTAAYKSVGESMRNPQKYLANVTGISNVLAAMHTHGVNHLVYSSSAAVYGEPQEFNVDENHPTQPVNMYGETKLIGEQMSKWFPDITTVNLRYFNVVGDKIGYREGKAENILPLLLDYLAERSEKFAIFGDDYDTPDGTCIRDYIDLRDLADAHVKALQCKNSCSINLGTTQGTSVKELVDTALQITGSKRPVPVQAKRPGDPAKIVANANKAKDVLSWQPKYSIKESIESMWKVYKN